MALRDAQHTRLPSYSYVQFEDRIAEWRTMHRGILQVVSPKKMVCSSASVLYFLNLTYPLYNFASRLESSFHL